MSSRRWAAAAAAAVLVAAVVAGTVALWPRHSDPAPEPVDYRQTLSASLLLPRLADNPEAVAVRVENNGSTAVRIVQLELITASFAPVPPTQKDTVIEPGQAKWLLVDYGPGVCQGQPSPPLAPTSTRIVVADDSGEHTLEFELPDAEYQGLGTRLRADCSAQVVSAAVSLRLDDWSTAPDGTLRANLDITRRSGDAPIALHVLRGSVLYTLTPPAGSPFGVLPPGQSLVEIPITVSPGRCDPHALADAKFPYQFRAWVTIGDSEQIPAAVDTDVAGQERLLAMWHAVCGF